MRDVIVAFIAENNRTELPFDETTDLIENRIVDSLQFVEFILFVEEVTGERVDPETLSVDDFRTIEAIERRFFSGAAR